MSLMTDGAIRAEIATRTRDHQAAVARFKRAPALPEELTLAPRPKTMLAVGDSWFDYPLNGWNPLFGSTDVIAQLKTMGDPAPLILKVSHWGDATTAELAWPKQKRMIDALGDPANWLNRDKPDAILFSGGGNDVVGDQFCIYLNPKATGKPGLDEERFQLALKGVEASYLDLFDLRDREAPGVPIIGHSYDFAIPSGVPACIGVGPWLLPALTFEGWDSAEGTPFVKRFLEDFRAMQQQLVDAGTYNFHLVPTQGLLGPNDWANELHPTPEGFRTIAEAFAKTIGKIPFAGV